jgi:hypothetical protein
MNRAWLATWILVCSFVCTAGAEAAPEKAPKHPKHAKPAAKPKPKPDTKKAHNPVHTHARTVPHHVHHNSYAGRTARSQTWYWHHRHHHWVYEVRVRSRAWHERAFPTYRSARTFMHYLRHHHFNRHLSHPTDNAWIVTYHSPHAHHYGTYASLPVARRVEDGLRASGFSAWLRWHRRYW